MQKINVDDFMSYIYDCVLEQREHTVQFVDSGTIDGQRFECIRATYQDERLGVDAEWSLYFTKVDGVLSSNRDYETAIKFKNIKLIGANGNGVLVRNSFGVPVVETNENEEYELPNGWWERFCESDGDLNANNYAWPIIEQMFEEVEWVTDYPA